MGKKTYSNQSVVRDHKRISQIKHAREQLMHVKDCGQPQRLEMLHLIQWTHTVKSSEKR